MIKSIPLAKLNHSPRNVRRHKDEDADRRLKADIQARGLLQNLVVTAVFRPRGRFAVEAGGRRLSALQALAAEGVLAKNHPVDCLLLDDGAAASEASLAENFQRLAMNPADECLAFSALIEQGSDIEGIARRFGVTIRCVEGRLRLASLAPVIFEALGAGEISLDLAKAYAATPDRERQEHVFEQMRHYGSVSPDSVRRMMTHATVSGSDRRALFVGEQAYVAAGGRVERDLFSEGDDARWLDIAILERLASEKIEAAATRMQAETGLAFVRPTLDSWIGHSSTAGLRRVHVEPAPLSEEEQAEADRLHGEIDALVGTLEHGELDDEEQAATQSEIRSRRARLEALVDRPAALDDERKAILGAFLMLDDEGALRLDSAYYAEEPSDSEGDEQDENEQGAGDSPVTSSRAGGLSQRLVDELAMQRRDILAVHVAADPALALDLAIFLMIDREAGYSSERSGSSLLAAAPANPVLDFKTPEAPATIASAQAAEALDRGWTEGETRAQRFDAFRALGDEARAAWLGHAVARTLEASLQLPGERNCAFHDHLGRLLGIEVARWWRPTGANYFDRVPKALSLEALAEVGGPAFAARYARAKKAELSDTCERVFAGEFIGEVELKQAALAWVPGPMRFASLAAEETEQADPGDDLPPWEEAPDGSEAVAADRDTPSDESGASALDERIDEAA